MNPNAKPFNPTAFLPNASDAPAGELRPPSEKRPDSGKTASSARDKRRRQRHRFSNKSKYKMSASVQGSERKLHNKKKLLANPSKKPGEGRRRQRRGKFKSTTAESTDVAKGSSNTSVIKEKQQKEIAAASAPLATHENSQDTHDPEFDLDTSFPLLSLASATVKNTESFWDDCQKNEALVSASTKTNDETSNVDKSVDNNDNTAEQILLHNNTDVPLVKLKSSKPTSFIAEKSIPQSTPEATDTSAEGEPKKQERVEIESSVNTESENGHQMPSLPNVKLKWNEAQISKMRNRLWEAERIKRQMDHETQQKKEADLSSESSSTSSEVNVSADGECDDTREPASLNNPFDESTTKQPSVSSLSGQPMPAAVHHTIQIPQEVIQLEQKCLKSAHPLHFMIRHYYLVKQKARSLSEADAVLARLLGSQSQLVEKWLSERMSLHDLFPRGLTAHVRSADIRALNPLQLCIILNLDNILQTILSTAYQVSEVRWNNFTFMEGDNLGRTPLMLACELHRLKCIIVLLKLTNKPKLDHREREGGNSAFHFCCMGKKMMPTDDDRDAAAAHTLKLLLNRTPHPLQKRMLFAINNQRKSLLHLACASGNLRLVDCILHELGSRGSNLVTKALNMKDAHHCVPFITAVIADARDIAMHLLVSRMNTVHYSTFFDGCPLTIASINRSVEMVRMLLEAGGHTSYDINRALLEAVQSDNNSSSNVDDSVTEKRCEIMSLLIACGANPHSKVSTTQYPQSHLIQNDTLMASRSLQQQSRPSDAPLTIAACSGDIEGVRTMMSSYSLVLPSQRSSRRNDPLLRLQTDSYFESIEKREDEMIDTSIQTALVQCLFRYYIHEDITSAKIALLIYRRGFGLSQKSVQWLMTCLKTKNVMCMDSIYSCMHAPTIIFQVTSPHVPDDTDLQLKWSKVFLDLNLFPSNNLCCPHLREVSVDQSSLDENYDTCTRDDDDDDDDDDDEFYLVIGEKNILAHKSIVSSKSGKLAAAIRFSEAQLRDNSERLSVRIDLPFPVAKMLLSHIYHGSIVFGLKSSSPSLQCYQLLDLVLLAEEYICPTLILECEMRLLGCGQCVCQNCLLDQRRLRDTEGGDSKYEYVIDASCSGVITAETALDVLAVAQQLEQSSAAYQCYYTTKQVYCNSSPATTKSIPGPFIAAKMAAISLIFEHFKDVISSASFSQHISVSSEEETMSLSQANCDKDAIMLLLMCLDEAVQWCNTSECTFTFPMGFPKFLL